MIDPSYIVEPSLKLNRREVLPASCPPETSESRIFVEPPVWLPEFSEIHATQRLLEE